MKEGERRGVFFILPSLSFHYAILVVILDLEIRNSLDHGFFFIIIISILENRLYQELDPAPMAPLQRIPDFALFGDKFENTKADSTSLSDYSHPAKALTPAPVFVGVDSQLSSENSPIPNSSLEIQIHGTRISA